MTCIKNLFKCNNNANDSHIIQNDWCEKNFKFLREKIIQLELDLKSLKVAHDLEIKRIEDKLLTQIQILTSKIDNILLIVNKH